MYVRLTLASEVIGVEPPSSHPFEHWTPPVSVGVATRLLRSSHRLPCMGNDSGVEHLARIHDAVRIKNLLHLLHQRDLLGAARVL